MLGHSAFPIWLGVGTPIMYHLQDCYPALSVMLYRIGSSPKTATRLQLLHRQVPIGCSQTQADTHLLPRPNDGR